jgi:BetI-type transcriptional repressor, C-terminal
LTALARPVQRRASQSAIAAGFHPDRPLRHRRRALLATPEGHQRHLGRRAPHHGLARLLALCDGFLSYVERRVFPGGCFFVATSAELGGRPGPVHDRVAAYQQQWRELLQQTAREASDQDELAPGTDPEQLAFELGAILAGTNIVAVLHSDDAVIDRARQATRQRLHP